MGELTLYQVWTTVTGARSLFPLWLEILHYKAKYMLFKNVGLKRPCNETATDSYNTKLHIMQWWVEVATFTSRGTDKDEGR